MPVWINGSGPFEATVTMNYTYKPARPKPAPICRQCGQLEARPGIATDVNGTEIGPLCVPCLLAFSPHDLTKDERDNIVSLLRDAVDELARRLTSSERDRVKWFRAWVDMTKRRLCGGIGVGSPAVYQGAEKTWWQGRLNELRGHRAIRIREE